MSHTSNFPDYIELEINNDFVEEIKKIIYGKYKNKIEPAKIYSYTLKSNIQSEKRLSEKVAFQDTDISNLITERLFIAIQSRLNNIIDYKIEIGSQHLDYIVYRNGGYFEPHQDFVRIKNKYHQQYTVLIGLSELKKYEGGSTVLWLPVDDYNRTDYNCILTSDDTKKLSDVFKKYNIRYCSKEDLFTIRDKILKTANTMEIIPRYFDVLNKGKALMFKSNIFHSGEEFYSFEKEKELLMVTLNLYALENNIKDKSSTLVLEHQTINLFNEFGDWMIDYVKYNIVIPFQIIRCKGTYNDKIFEYKYTTYWNFNNTIYDKKLESNMLHSLSVILQSIYNDTKQKLNTRHRETFISSKVLETTTDILSGSLSTAENKQFYNNLSVDQKYIQIIDNFVKNIQHEAINKHIVYTEKLNTEWEENGCNDQGDEYEDIVYLNCDIQIYFGFCKIDNNQNN